jgi:uncharacterized repeat protein (TIGR01451 family)
LATNGALTYEPGETNKVITVQVVGDLRSEPDETFFLNLGNATNANIVRTPGVVTIVNDDTNKPPVIVITNPVNGASFAAGADIVITANASDSDGTVTRVDFFAGATFLGAVASSPFTLTWSNIVSGSYSLTAKATDNEGATATSVPVNIVVVAPTNHPPMVRITRPADRTIFQEGEPILIEAEASDAEGPVQRVEFYAGTTKLGEATASPYRFLWLGAEIGDYALTARAVDQDGAVSVSDVVRVAVSDACGQVAIVRNFDGPEIAKLQDYMYELGVKSTVFSREEASVEKFALFDLVIWDDLGTNGLSNREVDLFRQVALRGKALYFIGDALVSAAEQLSEPSRSQWIDLIHLRAKAISSAAQQVEIDTATGNLIVLNGKVGTVQNFDYGVGLSGIEQLGANGEIVLARAGESDVLIALDNFAAAGSGRSLSQAFRVVSGVDEVSLAERKKIFQNAVWWLLNCRRCSALNLRVEGEALPPTVNVGQELTYKLVVSHSGECEALSVIVSSVLPPGMEFKEARAQRGQWHYNNGIVTFELGRMTSAAAEELQIIVRPTVAGLLTNYCTLSSLNEAVGALDDNLIEVVVEVLPVLEFKLHIDKPAVGPVEIKLTGPAGRESVLDTSTNGFDWIPVSTNELIGGTAVYVEPPSAATRYRTYRGRLR